VDFDEFDEIFDAEAGERHNAVVAEPLGQCPSASTMESVIFFVSPKSVRMLTRKNSSFSTPTPLRYPRYLLV
jgi:hypothetical protein